MGGEEKIPGGKPYVMKSAGKFTTPPLPVKQDSGVYPVDSTGAYPAILTLCDIIIESSGYGYKEGDEIVVIVEGKPPEYELNISFTLCELILKYIKGNSGRHGTSNSGGHP